MHDVLLVRGLQGGADLAGDGERFIEGDRPTGDPRCECLALDEFHHQVIRPDVVERANSRFVQGRNRPRLPLEPLGEVLPCNLDGDDTVQTGVTRAEDIAHSSGADRRHDLIGS